LAFALAINPEHSADSATRGLVRSRHILLIRAEIGVATRDSTGALPAPKRRAALQGLLKIAEHDRFRLSIVRG
jgi:hypothetical protein